MAFSGSVWSQLKNKTADDIIAALKKNGWTLEPDCKGPFRCIETKTEPGGIHYHPKKTFGPKLLQGLLDDIGWTEAEMKKLKLIK